MNSPFPTASAPTSDSPSTSEDPLSGLRAMKEGAPLSEIEAVLRALGEGLWQVDPLTRARLRNEMILELQRLVVQSPARWADSVISPPPAASGSGTQGSSLMFEDTEPWPDPVDGEDLLDELAATFRRHIVVHDHGVEAVSLWALLTWVFDAFVICPLLALLSPVKRCGKSTLLQILEAVTRRPLLMSNITTAALFRTIEAYQPTLLIDEFDTQIQNNEDLRGIINGGHARHTAHVIRTVGDDFEPKMFSVWSPKVLAGIGSLPDTLDDRSIRIRMKRRAPGETVERLRRDRLHAFDHLKSKAARWAIDNGELLASLDPPVPDLGNDRAADNWRPLIAIADAAGPRWGVIAREAAVALSRFEADDEDTWRILLLEDLRTLFSKRGVDLLPSKDIIDFLVSLDERPWPTSAKGRPINAAQVARLLKPFEVRPKSIRVNATDTKKGYDRADLLEQFTRYLSPTRPDAPTAAQTSRAPAAAVRTAEGRVPRSTGVAARVDTQPYDRGTGTRPKPAVPVCSGTDVAVPGAQPQPASAVSGAAPTSVPDVSVTDASGEGRDVTESLPADDDDDDDDPEEGPPRGGPGLAPRSPGTVSVTAGVADPPVTIVSSARDSADLNRRLSSCERPVGLDIETTGLDPRRDRLRLLSLDVGGSIYLVDCFLENPAPLFPALRTKTLVGHNLAFDLAFLRRLGFEPGAVKDTYLMSQVLDAGSAVPTGYHRLAAVAERHLGSSMDKAMQVSNWGQSDLSPAQLAYAADDARVLVDLHDRLALELAAAGLSDVADLENRCLPAMAWTADAGVPFSNSLWLALHEKNKSRAEAAHHDLLQVLGGRCAKDVNWNSPAQVRAAFEQIGIHLPNVERDTLATFDDPAVAALAAFRSANSQVRRYGPAFATVVEDRIYPAWRQIGAASGRMSCSEPNLQAIPRDERYRACFLPRPGRVLVKADYSQIELRLIARHTGDRRLMEAYRNGEDLHAVTARTILRKETVSRPERQLAKALNFGLAFGMGAPRFRNYARNNYGVILTFGEAEELRESFLSTYPGIHAWHREVAFQHRGGRLREVRTAFGRRRHVTAKTPYTEILNHPIQGGAADGLKSALALLWERRADCPDAIPVLLVHDEIVVEVPEDRAVVARDWLKGAMEDGMRPFLEPVPVVVETSR